MKRTETRKISVGGVIIGGGAAVTVQSMCNTPTHDTEATLAQIRRLADAGCDIVRVAVPDEAAAGALERICAESPLPVVADIHFDYRLALAAVRAGAAKIRINPGNIGSPDRVRAVAEACGKRGVPIRIGVNAGSLEKSLLEKYGGPTPEALAESAARHAALSPRMILFLKTGICGGFTTFSTFALETSGLLQAGRLPAAAAYVVLSVLLSVGAVVLVQALAG